MIADRHPRVAIVPLLIGHCAGMLDMVALPIWVGGLVAHHGLSLQSAGALVTAFLAGVVLASGLVSRRFARATPQWLAVTGFGLAALAFAVLSTRTSLGELAVLHLAAGMAVGVGLSAVHGTIGRSPNPHRLFAIAGISLGAFAVLMLGLLPVLIEARGAPTLFVVFAAVLAVPAIASALVFPRFSHAPGRIHGVSGFGPAIRAAILGVCLMTLNNAMVFSFVEVIGTARGFPREGITTTFIMLGLINFVLVAPLAMVLGKTLRAERVVLAGPLVQAALALTIATAPHFLPWAVAVAFYTGVQIFTHTFAFGLLARLDPSGRAVAATPAMLMTGAALGPILGGSLGQHLGFGALGAAAIVVSILAVAAFTRGAQIRTPAISPI